MEFAIVSGGMPTGPRTLDLLSLGGSETAALSVAKELSAKGHLVTLFCNLPPEGRVDHIPNNHIGEDGVRYLDINHAKEFVMATEVDALIISRIPDFMVIPHQARKCIFWAHDLATYPFAEKFNAGSWDIDEVWTVSEYHRQQFSKVTGYPLSNIWATRNGITRQNVDTVAHAIPKTLLYAARPERGLEHLVRPGGIMDRLPDYRLSVCMYDNFPDHMRPYYEALFNRIKEMPNVDLLPPQTQGQLRNLMKEHWAYVYPTNFEEVSCIIARESIEQQLPFFATSVGALPETLAGCGIIMDCDRAEIGSEQFCERFAALIEQTSKEEIAEKRALMAKRTDLYWDQVADSWVDRVQPAKPSLYSHVRSLIEDSDIIPAIALLNNASVLEKTQGVRFLENQLIEYYPYLFGRESFHDYYARYYVLEDQKGARGKPHMEGNPRFEAIAAEIAALVPGSRVLDYGCAEGVICNALAKRFPDKTFVAVDFNDGNISLARKYAEEDGLTNISFQYIKETDEIATLGGGFSAAICSEVLEHVTEPWSLIDRLEVECAPGARIIVTVPAGPWEATGLYNRIQFPWRAHIWHVTKKMVREMFKDKDEVRLNAQFTSIWKDGRNIGHTVVSFNKNGNPCRSIDPLAKAMEHRCRQTCGGAMIARNSEKDIIRCLDSITEEIQILQVALGPSDDHTRRALEEWSERNKWVEVRIKDVPAIEAGKFGFDDARNASIENLETDWVLWIDTDEYMSGSFKRYLRNNAFDSYAIHQHHFTCDPRGTPTQLDKPARLFRNNGTFHFYGKVHEHAEKGFNNGPGYVMILADVDIGHTGYVNENVRKGRFGRNLPFLKWDREVYPDRKLGMFLWLRDLIHVMREYASRNDMNGARSLAQEAVRFYDENAEKFQYIGGGVQQSIDYVSEARACLGIGVYMQVQVTLPEEKKSFQYQGIFAQKDDALAPIDRFLNDDFERRNSGYWR